MKKISSIWLIKIVFVFLFELLIEVTKYRFRSID